MNNTCFRYKNKVAKTMQRCFMCISDKSPNKHYLIPIELSDNELATCEAFEPIERK